jgi:chromosome segregation ATPase
VRALLLLSALLLIGCASQPRRAVIHYSPPSVAPVKQSLQSAQHHAKAAKENIKQAEKLAPANVPGLADALLAADNEIDALTNELLHAQTALADLETKTGQQTDDLNQANDDKNAALDRNSIIERKLKAIVGQRNKLFLGLLAAAAWIFRAPLIGLGKLLVGGI